MKVLVLENDEILEASLLRYVTGLCNEDSLTVVYQASQTDSETIMKCFEENQTLVFHPTMINHHQFMLMMMCMWNLLQENKLGIREVHVYHDSEEIEDEIREVFQNKKLQYLSEVLNIVKVYQIEGFENNKKELNLT